MRLGAVFLFEVMKLVEIPYEMHRPGNKVGDSSPPSSDIFLDSYSFSETHFKLVWQAFDVAVCQGKDQGYSWLKGDSTWLEEQFCYHLD